jgi:hypothetical protein
MDVMLEKAVKVANFMATLTNQRKLAFEEFKQSTIYYNNGASFTITPSFISYINTLVSRGLESAVVIDDNNVPAAVDNLKEFLDKIVIIYFEAANKYASKYNELKTKRKVEDLINV